MASFQVDILPCAESLSVQQEAPPKEKRVAKTPKTKAAPKAAPSSDAPKEAATPENEEVKAENEQVKVEGLKPSSKTFKSKAAASSSDGHKEELIAETGAVKLESAPKKGRAKQAKTDPLPVEASEEEPPKKAKSTKRSQAMELGEDVNEVSRPSKALKLEGGLKKPSQAKVLHLDENGEILPRATPITSKKGVRDAGKAAHPNIKIGSDYGPAYEIACHRLHMESYEKAIAAKRKTINAADLKALHLGENGEVLPRVTPITSKKGVRDAGKAAHSDMKIGSDYGPAYEIACYWLLMESYEKAIAAKRKTLKAVDA